jgi:opacity protein-like surface antigen
MKSIAVAAFAALAGSCLPATAEVSEDLKFCGERKSAPERLACFEAVTRGATKTAAPRPAARHTEPKDALASIPTKAPALEPLPARNPFDGYYAAIGGGYGLATGRDSATLSGPLTQAFFAPTSTDGPNASIVAGRNIAIGWGIIGAEISGRWAGEKYQETRQATAFSCCAVISMNGAADYRYHNDAGIHAAIRAGAMFDDLLIFGKAGVGATRVSESFTIDERGVQQCAIFFAGPNCPSFGPPSTTIARLPTASWLPSALFGLGMEKNWGPFFARVGADFEVFNLKATSVSGGGVSGFSGADHITWTTRGTALIGVRF